MWFVNQFDTTSAAYNIPIAVRLRGDLDVAAMETAIGDVLERHASLRTVFPNTPDGPVQAVRPAAEVTVDLAPVDVTEDELSSRTTAAATAGFDVTVEPPVRANLWRLGPQDHVLTLVVHHIAADGLSMAPLARDVMVAYEARAAGGAPEWSPLAVQYTDYSLWQRDLLGAEDDPHSVIARQLDFWRGELVGAPDLLELPTDRQRPPQQSMRGGTVDFTIAPHLHRRLLDVAGEHEASLFMVLHASLAVLLARLSGSSDIAIGSPVSGRGEAELDDLIGMFVGTIVLRTLVEPASTFSDLLAHTRATDLAALGNTDLPFERLVEVLDPTRSAAYSPLFQVMLVLQGDDRHRIELSGLTVEVDEIDTATAKFDLQLILTETADEEGRPGAIEATFSYATDLFDPDTVAVFAERFVRVLESVTVETATRVGGIDVLVDGERELVLGEWNATEHDVPTATLADLFDDQARRTPHAVALTFGDEELTYAQFASAREDWRAS
ncbi:condensation domain-containing protein [Prescottella defluvii]|nr:condensation domain-containing protein [Prescottella defluvii]